MCCTLVAASGDYEWLACLARISSKEAVMSTPNGSRPLHRHAATCARHAHYFSASVTGKTSGPDMREKHTLSKPICTLVAAGEKSQPLTADHSSQDAHGTRRDIYACCICVRRLTGACVVIAVTEALLTAMLGFHSVPEPAARRQGAMHR